MIKQKKDKGIVIDLDGPKGNAFYLLSIANRLMDQIDKTRTDKVLEEMRESNYLNLLSVFEKHFGSIVTLETNNQEYINHLNKDKNER